MKPGRNFLQGLAERILPLVGKIGADPAESDEMRLRKTLLVLGSFMFIAAGALWGILYFSFGELIAGSIPFGYAIFSSLSVIVFHLIRWQRLFLFTQLLLILLLPFLLMIALGGFIKSSAVILWSLLWAHCSSTNLVWLCAGWQPISAWLSSADISNFTRLSLLPCRRL